MAAVWALSVDPAHEGRGIGRALLGLPALRYVLPAIGTALLTTGRGTSAKPLPCRDGNLGTSLRMSSFVYSSRGSAHRHELQCRRAEADEGTHSSRITAPAAWLPIAMVEPTRIASSPPLRWLILGPSLLQAMPQLSLGTTDPRQGTCGKKRQLQEIAGRHAICLRINLRRPSTASFGFATAEALSSWIGRHRPPQGVGHRSHRELGRGMIIAFTQRPSGPRRYAGHVRPGDPAFSARRGAPAPNVRNSTAAPRALASARKLLSMLGIGAKVASIPIRRPAGQDLGEHRPVSLSTGTAKPDTRSIVPDRNAERVNRIASARRATGYSPTGRKPAPIAAVKDKSRARSLLSRSSRILTRLSHRLCDREFYDGSDRPAAMVA